MSISPVRPQNKKSFIPYRGTEAPVVGLKCRIETQKNSPDNGIWWRSPLGDSGMPECRHKVAPLPHGTVVTFHGLNQKQQEYFGLTTEEAQAVYSGGCFTFATGNKTTLNAFSPPRFDRDFYFTITTLPGFA